MDKKILLVDDTVTNLKLLGNMLRDMYSLSFATSGVEALKLLEKSRPDLVLLDIMMPGMDGFEVCKKIKSSPDLKEIPVLFITAKADKQSLAKSFELGGEGYILKPFEMEEVVNKIEKCLPSVSQLEEDSQNTALLTLSQIFVNNRIRNNKFYLDYDKMSVRTKLNEIEEKMEDLASSVPPLMEKVSPPEAVDSIRTLYDGLQNIQFQIVDMEAEMSDQEFSVSHGDFFPAPLIEDLVSAFPDNIRFRMDDTGSPVISGSDKYFIQVIVSLVDNAFQAAQFREMAPLVEITLTQNEKQTIVTIQDNGKGFSDPNASILKAPFFSTQKNNMGLGLTVVELLMKQEFKGRITLENNGEGCKAQITFPKP